MTPSETLEGPETVAVPFEHRGAPSTLSCLLRRGTGETLLYFHGLGSDKEDFLGAWSVPEWNAYTLAAFDAPGCGATRGYRPGIPLGVDDIVSAAEAVVAQLDLDDLTVIGHSMGGLAGLLFTLRHRGSVRRLVSVEGNLGPEDCSIYSRRVFRRRFLGREEEFMEELERELRESEFAGFAEAARSLCRNVQLRAFFDYCRSIVEYSDHHPLLDAFISLDLKKLYVHGSENAHLTHLPRLSRNGVPICSVPASNHFPAHSNPAFYYHALAAFVRETSAEVVP